MLVLSRKPGESVLIGSDVVLTVLEIENDRVRLGIVAPRELLVLRQELRDQVRQENLQSAGLPDAELTPILSSLKKLLSKSRPKSQHR